MTMQPVSQRVLSGDVSECEALAANAAVPGSHFEGGSIS